MIRRLFGLVVLAIVPWLLACSISLAEVTVFRHSGDAVGITVRDLFGLPGMLIPIVVFASAVVIATLRERNPDSVLRSQWVAGGWFAGWSTLLISVLGLCWGGTYGFVYLSAWAFFSGYIALSWCAGAYVWRGSTFARSGMSAAAAWSLMSDRRSAT